MQILVVTPPKAPLPSLIYNYDCYAHQYGQDLQLRINDSILVDDGEKITQHTGQWIIFVSVFPDRTIFGQNCDVAILYYKGFDIITLLDLLRKENISAKGLESCRITRKNVNVIPSRCIELKYSYKTDTETVYKINHEIAKYFKYYLHSELRRTVSPISSSSSLHSVNDNDDKL